jgi:hypothetical protein
MERAHNIAELVQGFLGRVSGMSPDGDRRQGTRYSGRRWTLVRKQSNGTPGKNPPTLSVSITQGERAAARLAGYRRQALEILSGAGSRGYTTLLAQMAQGFTTDTLAGLVRDGLATAAPETVMAGGRTIEITRVKITDAGRRALGYERRLPLYLPIAR